MTSRVISAFAAEEEKRVLSLKPVLAPVHGRYGDHPHQVYDAWPADDPDAPRVILLHGGYWRYDRMHLTPFAAYLAGQGFDVLLPGFRRSGGAGGYPETFDDVARIVDTLPDGRPYVLAGHCSGGHLALWCAARGLLPGRLALAHPHPADKRPGPGAAHRPRRHPRRRPQQRRGPATPRRGRTLRGAPAPGRPADPAARRGHDRRADRPAARRRGRGGPAHPVRRLRGRPPRPAHGRPARHRPLHPHRTGRARRRAVADTLREMAAAFPDRRPEKAHEEAAHR